MFSSWFKEDYSKRFNHFISSFHPTWFSSMKQKVHTTFLGEICPNWTFFAARTPSRCASTALTCTQFMGSKPQQTASCLSLTIPCYFLFVFAEHMCKNSPFHLCWSLNYTDFFSISLFFIRFSWALRCIQTRLFRGEVTLQKVTFPLMNLTS